MNADSTYLRGLVSVGSQGGRGEVDDREEEVGEEIWKAAEGHCEEPVGMRGIVEGGRWW